MSHLLYTTRLFWSGGRGVAKLHGITVQLAAPPTIAGAPVDAIDYTPEVRAFCIRRPFGGWHEMTRGEIEDADRLLRLATAAAAAAATTAATTATTANTGADPAQSPAAPPRGDTQE